MKMKKSLALRAMLAKPGIIVAPGVTTALFARLIEDTGFSAQFVTGAGLANIHFGLPDYNLVTMTENLELVKRINDNTTLPLIVDIDNGYGSALNVYRTVREFSRLDVGALVLEDQQSPKRCGHFEDQVVIPIEEMCQKLRAAREASVDPDLVLVARTDAIAATGSLDEGIRRGNAYAEAGADIVFVEAPRSEEQLARIPKELKVPALVNLVEGGNTPLLTNTQLEELGFKIVIYANATMKAALKGMKDLLVHLREDGTTKDDDFQYMIPSPERHRLTGKDFYKDLQMRYGVTKK